jgi:hypothetical protein
MERRRIDLGLHDGQARKDRCLSVGRSNQGFGQNLGSACVGSGQNSDKFGGGSGEVRSKIRTNGQATELLPHLARLGLFDLCFGQWPTVVAQPSNYQM